MVRLFMTSVEHNMMMKLTHITDKKIDMDNLLPQTLTSRLSIPDYDSSDNSDKDVINKKYVDSKTFILDV